MLMTTRLLLKVVVVITLEGLLGRQYKCYNSSAGIRCLKVDLSFVNRLQEVSDVAVMQASALQARQNSKEKEIQALRRELLAYQVPKFPTRTDRLFCQFCCCYLSDIKQ